MANQSQILSELKERLKSTFWKLRAAEEEWRQQLYRNELRHLSGSIKYLQTQLSKKP